MPQRTPGARVAQLLSNNNSLLAGTGGGLVDIHNNNASLNGRHFPGNPVAAAVLAASSQPPPPPSQQPPVQPPPLITDTLNACLDVNGTYICTSYSPRCYIIQKVTPNTITVTPHDPPPSSTPPNNQLLPLLPSKKSPKALPSPSLPVASSSSHLHPLHPHHPHHNHPPPPPQPPPNFPPPQRQYYPPPSSYHSHAPPNYPRQIASVVSSPSPQNSYLQKTINSAIKPPVISTSNSGNSPYFYQKSGPGPPPNLPVPSITTVSSSAVVSSIPTPLPGRVYMNGEVGSTTGVFSGEESIPAMVHQSATAAAAGAGTHFTENRLLNGLKDGSREPMKPSDVTDPDFADSSRRNDPGGGPNSSSDLPKEELKRLLLQQLEYYFSPENLANDKFLVSQMDSDHYVYISTLANFNMVKKLTGDIDLVTEVLRDSKNVQVHSDGKRVRPVSHRTVVILRGIPETTPVDEIKALFSSENCPKCNSCEFAFNDSWYVSFDSDEDAQRAHRYLREDVKEFKGQPIMARIKSRPTTLLAQGPGVHLKNGYHQPAPVMGSYLPPAFVPGTAPSGPASQVPQTPMYATHAGQTVPSVFQMAPNYNYGHWPNVFGLAPESFSQMYSMNGLAPQHQPSGTYPKSLPMNTRPRNPNPVRARRPPPSSSDNQGMNGVGSSGAGGSNTPTVSAHQSYQNPSRKNPVTSVASAAPPPPLLNLVPNPPSALPLVAPQGTGSVTGVHNHSQGGGHLGGGGGSGPAISQNGRHYVPGPPLSGASSHSGDSYHPQGSMRPYRGGGGGVGGDSRPRSSLSNRKGPPPNSGGGGGPARSREEEQSYEGPTVSASPLMGKNVPSRGGGAPPPANVPVSAPPPQEISGGNHHHHHHHQHHHHHPPQQPAPPQQQPQSSGKINFDLEGSAFPPLPGSGTGTGKNGEAVFEGRLSDVVKGVKNVKVGGDSSSSSSKAVTGTVAPSSSSGSAGGTTEIIVSARELCEVREVSAASPPPQQPPVKSVVDVGVGGEDRKRTDREHASSQTCGQSGAAPGGKKEFREVGVGSADDTHDIRSSLYKSSVLSGARSKETADKSTRTDEALLNGDQSQGVKTTTSSSSIATSTSASPSPHPPQSYPHSQNGGGRKSTQGTMTSSATITSTKSPMSTKRAAPVPPSSSSPSAVVSVGPEVPYSPCPRGAATSPVTAPAPPHAKSCASQTSSSQIGGAAGQGRGASSVSTSSNANFVAKSTLDNNAATSGSSSRANGGMVSAGTNTAAHHPPSISQGLDKDAFPSPTGFAKSVPSAAKPFPNQAGDQSSKEVTRTDAEKDRKESGQGDAKKGGEDCSTAEHDNCPIRLSYAQVAQQRKEQSGSAAAPPVSSGNSTGGGPATSGPSSVASSLDDKKKPGNTKDSRGPPTKTTSHKNQRGSGGGGGGERGYNRRGFRNRMMSDHSDGGASVSSADGGGGGGNRRLPKPSRSPK